MKAQDAPRARFPSLRDAYRTEPRLAATDAYRPTLLDRFHRFKEWEDNLDLEECQRSAAAATAVARHIDSGPT